MRGPPRPAHRRHSGRLHTDLDSDPRSLHRLLRQASIEHPPQAELLLIVDQFEEVFTLCHDHRERDQFLDALLTAAQVENSRCRLVLGVRADFYAHCTTHPELVEALRDAQLAVGPLTTDELRQIITQPAVHTGCTVETALVSRIVGDATGQPGVLPLVSHALLETWRRRRGNALTLTGYDAAGGIERAVANTAEHTYTSLAAGQQRLARQIFLRLTALGEGTEDTKRRIHRSELDADHPDTTTVLEHLTRARLLTVDQGSIEISHEALIRCWPRLRAWLAEDREGFRIHRQLTEATEAWAALRRDPGALYRGARLSVARDWAERRGDALTPREREFLDASLAAQAREQALARRHIRRLRQLVTLLTALLLVTVTSTGYAIQARNTATEQRNTVLSQQVAGQATALRAADPALAAQLGLAAYRLVPTVEARGSLLSTFATPYATRLIGHTSSVDSAAVSPDGRILATSGEDTTTRLWAAADPHHPRELATLRGHESRVKTVAFRPDGQLLATGSDDRTVRFWDVTDPAHPGELAALANPTGAVIAVAFNPDGRLLVTGGDGGTVRLWDVRDPRHARELSVLAAHTDAVESVAFSADGHTLATAGDDGTVRLWDVGEPRYPRELADLIGHTGRVNSVAFSPDGHTLATVGSDVTTRLWDTDLERVTTRICATTYPTITPAQWEHYFPGLKYQPPCP